MANKKPPETAERVLHLYRDVQLSVRQIAEREGLAQGTVRGMLHGHTVMRSVAEGARVRAMTAPTFCEKHLVTFDLNRGCPACRAARQGVQVHVGPPPAIPLTPQRPTPPPTTAAPQPHRHPIIDRAELTKWYVEQQESVLRIAIRLRCSETAVYAALHRAGIALRPRGRRAKTAVVAALAADAGATPTLPASLARLLIALDVVWDKAAAYTRELTAARTALTRLEAQATAARAAIARTERCLAATESAWELLCDDLPETYEDILNQDVPLPAMTELVVAILRLTEHLEERAAHKTRGAIGHVRHDHHADTPPDVGPHNGRSDPVAQSNP